MKFCMQCTCLLVFATVFLTSCSVDYGPKSLYNKHYENLLKEVQLPETEDIQREGVVWTFSKPLDEVWPVCVKVVSQYEGILGLATGDPENRRLMFVHGRDTNVRSSLFSRNKYMVFNKFIDVWVAVSLTSDESGGTIVAAAPVSPENLKVTSTAAIAEQDNREKGQKRSRMPERVITRLGISHARTVGNMPAVASAFSQDNRSIAMQLSKARGLKKTRKLVPEATINEFFYHLGTQLYGPQQWRMKFDQGSTDEEYVCKTLKELKFNKVPEKHVLLEQKAANWTSAKLRRSLQVIDCPDIEDMFHTTAQRLAKAAGRSAEDINVYIVASPEINAFALPNREIFICSGLLEMMETQDEIAAVLGHELDHVYQHDTIERLESIQEGKFYTTLIVVGGAVAGGAVSAAAQPASAAAASTSTSIGTNLAVQSIGMASSIIGQSVGAAIVEGYSVESELRADKNGAKYMWAAGYDVEAELRMLRKLGDYRKKAIERKENIASGLVNGRPGPQKRLEEMEKVIATLQ